MTDTDKLSAMEAVAMLAEATISRNGHEMDMPYADMQRIWESAKRLGLARVQMAKYRVFLQAYLQALAEDNETVEAVAGILRHPYGGIHMQALAVLAVLAAAPPALDTKQGEG